jgi:hypothetical protein
MSLSKKSSSCLAAPAGEGRKIVPSSLATPDMEDKEAIGRLLVLERVAGLAQEMGNVDDGERIGAFDDQTAAMRQTFQHLTGPQHGQRTVQAAQIERGGGNSGHTRLPPLAEGK